LDVQELPGIPAADRRYVLLRPGESVQYLDRYGAEQLFTGVPDRLVAWWCVWYGELVIEASELQELATNALRKVVDKRIPNCAMKEWYQDLFISAEGQCHKRFDTIQKKKQQINAIWNTGDWYETLDPGKFIIHG
jgi:hypothetical protein